MGKRYNVLKFCLFPLCSVLVGLYISSLYKFKLDILWLSLIGISACLVCLVYMEIIPAIRKFSKFFRGLTIVLFCISCIIFYNHLPKYTYLDAEQLIKKENSMLNQYQASSRLQNSILYPSDRPNETCYILLFNDVNFSLYYFNQYTGQYGALDIHDYDLPLTS